MSKYTKYFMHDDDDDTTETATMDLFLKQKRTKNEKFFLYFFVSYARDTC